MVFPIPFCELYYILSFYFIIEEPSKFYFTEKLSHYEYSSYFFSTVG